jgi:hypothetical protein
MQEENMADTGVTRRQMVESLLLLGLLGAATGLDSSTASAQSTVSAQKYQRLRKTLIERLVNTRYHPAPDGSIVVLHGDEVWPGESGGAYHADWLFNELSGLANNPYAALEDTVIADKVHEGIMPETDLSPVTQILENAKLLGLFDDIGLIYQVMREKISIETAGAHSFGVRQFREWALVHPEFTQEQRDTIDSAATLFLNVAYPHSFHDFY